MKTGAALFLCLAMAAPASASDCEKISSALNPMIAATEKQIEILENTPFSSSAIILSVEDRNVAYKIEQSKQKLINALVDFLDKQKDFSGALKNCS